MNGFCVSIYDAHKLHVQTEIAIVSESFRKLFKTFVTVSRARS